MGKENVKKAGTIFWYTPFILVNMVIGASSVLTTLVALSLGASVADIGLMTSAGAAATIVFSTVWGRLSDISGVRKNYLVFLFAALGPLFILLGFTDSVLQLVVLNTVIMTFISGVTPIAVMYVVESCKTKDWHEEVARYNSITNVGAILGLIVSTMVSAFFRTSLSFYLMSAFCIIAAISLWKIGEETKITLERQVFPIRNFRDAERFLIHRSFFHYLRLRRVQFPRRLSQFKPLQLLFLACFMHWLGIFSFMIGQVPIMKDLNLSDSVILAINAVTGTSAALAFSKIAPAIKTDYKKLIRSMTALRTALILYWSMFPLLFIYQLQYVFVFPLLSSIVFPITYAIVWLPIVTSAISFAPHDRKGATQGELLSILAIANTIGSAIGGYLISVFGYTIGFVVAAIITLLSTPIFSKIDMP
ncbi:MAG: MFS transporter [Nitrososphaeria archaeon]